MNNYKKITIDSYNKTVKEYIKIVDKLHPSKEASKFMTLVKNGKILDLGCGPGRDSKIFAGHGFNVTGIDLSANMIKAAKKRVKNAKFIIMDMQYLKFKTNSFEGIWANAAYLHLAKNAFPQALKEAKRVLKKNGVLYLSVKKGQGGGTVPDNRYGGVQKFWSFFSKKELESSLRRAGFKILSSYIGRRKHSYATHPWIVIFCRIKSSN